ncbi:hypothetical protein D3C80_2206730 [compost metagenome]
MVDVDAVIEGNALPDCAQHITTFLPAAKSEERAARHRTVGRAEQIGMEQRG